MENRVKAMDPRVKRTRQLLQQVFTKLLKEKSFHDITVQDIAQRATVNRATFYAHFEDKYALLDTYILEEFQRVISSRLPASSSLNEPTLHLLILAVLEYFALVQSGCKPSDRQIEPRFAIIVQQELHRILLDWLKKLPPTAIKRRVPLETIASTISWAIFGAGVQWNFGETTYSAQEMTNQILAVISSGLFQIVRVETMG
jgi:AcrR family transcriptional regulator